MDPPFFFTIPFGMTPMVQANPDLQTRPHKWPVFSIVASGVFLSTMDSSMVNVALPSIMRSFDAPLIQVQWVVLIYLLSISVTLLLWGIAADRFGMHVIYLIGVGTYACGALACFWSPSLLLLIFCRCIEGLGGAMMMSSGPAIIRDVFPRHQIGKGLGLVGIATSMGLMSGPVVSGVLITHFSWRAIFLAGVLVSLIILISGYRILRQPGVLSVPGEKRLFDWKGALLWATLVSAVMLFAHFFMELNPSGKVIGFSGIALLITLFIWAERTRKSSILPLHLFAKSYYHIGLITAALSFGALFVVLILMPFYLDYIKGMAADYIGLAMMAVPITLVIVSPTAGFLYDRIGSRYLTTLGLGLSFIALLLLSQLSSDSTLADICWRLALVGMGQSIFLAPNTASLLSRIGDTDAGVTSGLLATSRNLGMLAGAAFGGITFAAWFGYFSGGDEIRNFVPAQTHFFISALQATFLCTALISLIAAVISWQREK